MKYEELIKLSTIPKWLDCPMYPGGFPIQPENHSVNGKTIRGMAMEPGTDEDTQQYIKEYLLYYLWAPLFNNEVTNEVRSKVSIEDNYLSVFSLMLDVGLDPL